MMLRAPNGDELTFYYNNNICLTPPCRNSDHTDWWRISPYNREETKDYVIRMLGLPLLASGVFIVISILSFWGNPILQLTSSILSIIASFLLWSFIREQRRAERYKITAADGLIDVPIPYNVAQEANLFKFNLIFI